MDSITYGLQTADYSIARIPNGAGGWQLALPTAGQQNAPAVLGAAYGLRINEWMANPGSGSDWFEIYNPNLQPVLLSGLCLTDDLADRTRYQIPALSFIGAGEQGYAQFIADNNPGAGANHTKFRMSTTGEALGLFFANGTMIDAVTYGPQTQNVSEGRFPDGSTNIVKFPSTATPEAANLLALTDVVINEVLTHTDPPFEDAIELYNTTLRSIDISGWYLTDNKNDPRRFRIPPNTIIPSHGFVVFYEYQFNPDYSARPPYFALSGGHGDDVYLFSADPDGNLLGYRTGVNFGAAEPAVSFGRYLSSIDVDFVPLSSRTFGMDNPATVNEFRTGTGLSNALPKVGPVVISEIMYHPPGTNTDLYEFIELRNTTNQPVPLYNVNAPTNTWRLRDAVDYDFPMDVTIPGSGALLVVGFDPVLDLTSRTNFCAYYGLPINTPLYGPWQGRLANDNDRVELYKPDDPEPITDPEPGFVPYVLVERIHYRDSKPWPSAADGTNAVPVSLQRIDVLAYGNDPTNWYAGSPTPAAANGAPFGTLPSITSLTPSQRLNVSNNLMLTATATGGQLTYQWYFNGVAIPNAVYGSYGINNMQAPKAGDYVVVVSNPNGAASGRIHIDIAQPPVIVTQPQPQYAALGGSAVFSATVLGSAPLTYQWQRDGTNLPGQTGLLLVINNIQAADQSSYRLVVTNSYGSATSDFATLSLSAAPAIVTQPQGTNIFAGNILILHVLASGTAPLRYQWRKDGVDLVSGTNATLILPSVTTNDSGSYTVYITNRVGTVLSSAAVVNVIVPPTVMVTALNSPAFEPSGLASFLIVRSGSTALPLTVSYTVAGTAIPGQDYVALTSPVTIPVGASSTNVLVTVLDDALPEGDETVILTLSASPDYALGGQSTATVVIKDNDNLSPAVALTSPSPGLFGNAPATVLLSATATDPDGSVAKVVFYSNDTNKLGELTAPPYTMTWTNVAAGNYALRAVAIDNLGSSGLSAPVSITVNALPQVSLTSPANNSSYYVPAVINLAATAVDPDGSITQVQFFSSGALLATITAAPYSMSWSNSVIGDYTIVAVATDNRGATNTSAPVNISVTPPAVTFTDNFRDRPHLAGYTNYIVGSNNAWTKEPGERNHADAQGGHSGWISWTAPASGLCVVQTTTAGLAGVSKTFDTVLAVYTGTSVTNLAWVASNDDALNPYSLQSFLTFYAVEGASYEIAIDGWDSTSVGNYYFRMGLPDPKPVIVTQPASQSVAQGATATFTVVANGPGTLSYQWQFQESNLLGATSSILTLPNCQGSNEGPYRVIVSNSSGSVISTSAVLTVRVAPNITTQPLPQLVNLGDPVTFTVVATGSIPMSYQWMHKGLNIAGATNSTYTCNYAHYTNAGNYTVRLLNGGGLVISQPAELNVRPRFLPCHMSNGVFVITGEGVPGKTYSLDWTSTFTNWTSLGSINNTGVQMQFQHSTNANSAIFYRFRQTP